MTSSIKITILDLMFMATHLIILGSFMHQMDFLCLLSLSLSLAPAHIQSAEDSACAVKS
jgi:hypothetical protein